MRHRALAWLRSRGKRLACIVAAGCAAACLVCWLVWMTLPARTWIDTSRFVRTADAFSVVDRHGQVLRQARVEGVDRRWVGVEEVSDVLLDAIIAAEDLRFRSHHGVDPRAMARAVVLDLIPWTTKSGASTITQQLVKLVYGRRAGAISKAMEIPRAATLEKLMTKQEILEQYINRLPYGDRIEGVARACEAYLGHPPSHMTVAEAALIAGIPQAPSITEPRRHLPRALRRRNVVLDRMLSAGMIDLPTYQSALAEVPTIVAEPTHPDRAPRFVDWALDQHRQGGVHRDGKVLRTSLDWQVHEHTQRILRSALDAVRDRGATNAAAIVVANDTAEVVAYVGAADRQGPGGALDLLARRRQPGSTLKPFVYSLLFEKGGTAATLLADVVTPMTGAAGVQYEARDYDGKQRGPVRARIALAASLNLAALDAAGRVGQHAVVQRFRSVGLSNLAHADHYGAAAVLGGVDVAPAELAQAYLTLARRGVGRPLSVQEGQPKRDRAVLDPTAAALVTDILSDTRARADAFGSDLSALAPSLRFALKTGTSSGWKDAWAVAYSSSFTVVVWVGDPDARPMASVSGFVGAAPAAVQILKAAHDRATANAIAEPQATPTMLIPTDICAWSGKRPGSRCHHVVQEKFAPGTIPAETCNEHDDDGMDMVGARFADWVLSTKPAGVSTRWLSPLSGQPVVVREPADGSRLVIDPTRGETAIRLRAAVGGTEVRDAQWLVDGLALQGQQWVLSEGTHRLHATWHKSRSNPVTVVVSASR